MRRREFIALLGGVATAWSVVARAQQTAMPVIGYFSGRSSDAETPFATAFRQGLEEAGYVEDHNVAIEFRFSNGQDERLPALAGDLVRRDVTVLVATDTPSALVAKQATTTISDCLRHRCRSGRAWAGPKSQPAERQCHRRCRLRHATAT